MVYNGFANDPKRFGKVWEKVALITIKDLARTAGVSVKNFSRALNGYNDVSEETRRNIKRVAEELNYRPT
jgi:LacI family transcriptional regulator